MKKSFSLAFFFFPLYFPGTKHSLKELNSGDYLHRQVEDHMPKPNSNNIPIF